jgi:hypothetical protein
MPTSVSGVLATPLKNLAPGTQAALSSLSPEVAAAVQRGGPLSSVLPSVVTAMAKANPAFAAAAFTAAGVALLSKGTAPFEAAGMPLGPATSLDAGMSVKGAYLKQVGTSLGLTTGSTLAPGAAGSAGKAGFGVTLDNSRLSAVNVELSGEGRSKQGTIDLTGRGAVDFTASVDRNQRVTLSRGTIELDAKAGRAGAPPLFGTSLRLALGDLGTVLSGRSTFEAAPSEGSVDVRLAGSASLGPAGVMKDAAASAQTTVPLASSTKLVATVGMVSPSGAPASVLGGADLVTTREASPRAWVWASRHPRARCW